MGFEGSVLAMINSLKNNKKLLAKRKTFRDRKNEYRYKTGEALKFKELPEEELIEVKSKIRSKLKRQRLIGRAITVFVTIALVIFAVIIFIGINKRTIERQSKIIQERQEYFEAQAAEEAQRKEKRILYYLNKGYSSLSNKEYRNAKYYFYKAKHQDNADSRVLIGYAKAYVYDCVYNKNECESVEGILNNLSQKYASEAEVIELQELYFDERK